jgi:hypothetical protein
MQPGDFVALIEAEVAAPLLLGAVPGGERRVVPITGGRVSGPHMTGEILSGGADTQLIRPDGVAEIEARYVLRLADGALVHVINRGLRHAAPEDMARLLRGEPVPPERVYFRTAPVFETAAPALAWLHRFLFVGVGERRPDRVLARALQLEADTVHFRSTGDATAAILSGDVQGMFATVALAAPLLRDGRLRALGTTGTTRAAGLPDVPTMAELGLPALTVEAWFGLVAPAATPEPVLAALDAAMARALAAPSLRARLAEAGFRAAPGGRAAFAARLRDETARWAGVVRETGFRAIE